MDFKQKQKTQRNLPESNKKIVTKTKHKFPIKFSIYPSYKFKNWNMCFNFKFYNAKKISRELQSLRKGPYQIIDKPTNVTYKLTDLNKKKIVQHRNNLLPYYPKEYALRELSQLYSFTGHKVLPKISEQNRNQNADTQVIQK